MSFEQRFFAFFRAPIYTYLNLPYKYVVDIHSPRM